MPEIDKDVVAGWVLAQYPAPLLVGLVERTTAGGPVVELHVIEPALRAGGPRRKLVKQTYDGWDELALYFAPVAQMVLEGV
jgi:hypothetical protein